MPLVKLEGLVHTGESHKPDVCRGCPAFDEPGPVWSEYNGKKLIVVGEAPGETECTDGIPFIGNSGGLLWSLLSRIGVSRAECFVTNTAKCNTKREGAFAYCAQTFLRRELEDPSLRGSPILALGNEAKRQLMPELGAHGIVAARGTKIGNCICALHPAFIRRSLRFGAQEDKQDLTPTLAQDAYEAVSHQLPKELRYIEGIPPRKFPNTFTSCDLETEGFDFFNGHITQIGWGVDKGVVYREQYTEAHREVYQEALLQPTTFHNMLFDVPFLTAKGYNVPNPNCSMLAAHLLNPDLPLGLEFQNSLFVHYPPWKGTARQNMAKYHATDLDTTWQVWDAQVPLMKLAGVWSLYQNELLPVTKRMCELKLKGVKIDREKMMKLNIGLGMRVNQIDNSLNKVAPGVDFNSPKQVGTYLYDVLGLEEKTHSKSGNRTTDADALEELSEQYPEHPILKLLMARRQYEKMRTTYTTYSIDNDDYMHHDISFTAATGRARGFLLTIQRGPMRSLFIADEPGWEMLYADWSQIELWISAIVSGDKQMQHVLDKMSLHAYTAARFKGGPADKTNPYYTSAKFITHGYNFGRGEKAIARDHEIPLSDVVTFGNWLLNQFPVWAAWRQDQYNQARNVGALTNRFGFTRRLWSGNIRGMAFSFDPQSTPAHMIKRTILSLWPELPQPARIVLPVHDALIVTYPTPMREEVTRVVKEHMEQPWEELGGWRARCEIGYGKNWQEAS